MNACGREQPPPIIQNAIFSRCTDADTLFQFKKEGYHFQGMPIYSCSFKHVLRFGFFGSHYLIADSTYLYELLIDNYCEKYYEQSQYTIHKGIDARPIAFKQNSSNVECNILIYPALCFSGSPGDTFKIYETGSQTILDARLWDAHLADSIYCFRFQERQEKVETVITVGRATGIKGLARRHFDAGQQKFYITELEGKPFEPYFPLLSNSILQVDTTRMKKEKYQVNLSKIKAFHKILGTSEK